MFEFRSFVDDKIIHKHDLNGLKELHVAGGLIV